MTVGRWFKDGKKDGYVNIIATYGNCLYGYYHHDGDMIDKCAKVWYMHMHEWEPFSEKEYKRQCRIKEAMKLKTPDRDKSVYSAMAQKSSMVH